MKDTNQLPQLPNTSKLFEDDNNIVIGYTADQMRAYALQARAQVQGEPFGYIHHFAAHDESGALIDTTWEADGCADPLPHPTFPAMWKWSQSTPFYTTPPASQEQADAATSAGTQAAIGHLSRLVDEATSLISQLRTMVDDMHEQWSIGGVPERGEFPLLDRVDDWLSARPSQEQAQQTKCACGDRPVDQCDEEWGPNCDLGNNEKYVRVAHQPSVTVRYDLSPAMVEGAIRDRLIAMGWTPPLQQPKPQPMTDDEIEIAYQHTASKQSFMSFRHGIRSAEAHNGITAQAEKGTP